MLKYDNILEFARLIQSTNTIKTNGLIIHYEIDEKNHFKLDEDLFYRLSYNKDGVFKHNDIIEVNIGNIKFKITKKV